MQYLLCIKCGEEPLNSTVCQNCGNLLEEDRVLLEYAHEAYFFGYEYRKEYEIQVEKYGKIYAKYNLVEPETIWQLLAAFALGGLVGNVTYDLIKTVGIRIVGILKRDKKENEFRSFVELVSDDSKLRELFNYIQSYYYGMPDSDRKVSDAIFEEKMVDLTTSKLFKGMEESDKKLLEIIKHNPKNETTEELAEMLLNSFNSLKKVNEKNKDVEIPSKEKLIKVLTNLKR